MGTYLFVHHFPTAFREQRCIAMNGVGQSALALERFEEIDAQFPIF
jgi:hypothetical protein